MLIKLQAFRKGPQQSTEKNDDANSEKEVPKKICISRRKTSIIDELRLVPKRMYISRNYWLIKVSIKRKIRIPWRQATDYWWIKVSITV